MTMARVVVLVAALVLLATVGFAIAFASNQMSGGSDTTTTFGTTGTTQISIPSR
jgi:hypothetical protein